MEKRQGQGLADHASKLELPNPVFVPLNWITIEGYYVKAL